MRSFSAAALLALAIITECFGAQSDRSRQRSGPIRSVPVAADIKRDTDFDCPEEFGYYPHPTDCTLYYVCVFGGALLESCTGGLMYSHELQTCDWPRNVGCDGTSAIGVEDLERINERDPPPPPPPRRTPPPPPPPPPRAQPNPVVTSRGQPKFNRDEYEKQQQLYAEVDDLPPVEEIETDRQQRVNRGQPSTIGQVQKDRDGYVAQVVSSGRNLNSNIIPASISQNNGKVGSFSFGTQLDDRRTAVVTQAPQTYSEDKSDYVTDYLHDRQLDIETNEINVDHIEKLVSRRKRDVLGKDLGLERDNMTNIKDSSARSDKEEIIYSDIEMEPFDDDINQDDSERGKRQIRYYVKNGYKPVKNWVTGKPIKLVNLQQYNYNSNTQNDRFPLNFNEASSSNSYDAPQSSYPSDSNIYLTAESYPFYQISDSESQRNPFKPSLPDPTSQKYIHNPANVATQIITKSPPISSLKSSNNPFAALAGGFYNNSPKPIGNQFSSQMVSSVNRPNHQVLFPDSSQVPSTIVTGKPILISTLSPNNPNEYKVKAHPVDINDQNQKKYNSYRNGKEFNQKHVSSRPPTKDDYPDRDNSNEDEESNESSENYSSEKNRDVDGFNHDFPDPPYEFTHPSHKFAEIENPFANPNFDFDAFLTKLSGGQYTTPKFKNVQLAALRVTNPPPVESTTTSNYNSGIPVDAIRPKLKPPNFKDERQLPINHSFDRPTDSTHLVFNKNKLNSDQTFFSVTQKPYSIVSATGVPLSLTTPKQQYILNPDKNTLQPLLYATGKPYLVSTSKPLNQNTYTAFKHSTAKPLTTLANEQLSALQNYWRNPSTESQFFAHSTPRPNLVSEFPIRQNYVSQTNRPLLTLVKGQNIYMNIAKNPVSTTTVFPLKRKPIPKPSPEMNDYYYDDEDEQYYFEPPVKSKYMPSTEVRPKRPPMAQNYKEYDDYYGYDEDPEEKPVNVKPTYQTSRIPTAFTTYKPNTATKSQNDVSAVTKAPIKDFNKVIDGKIAIPVMINYGQSILTRPEISNYEIIHQSPRNKTTYARKPTISTSSPFTHRPPKYLNQTTLRPYTVRHRLAKPTVAKDVVTVGPTEPTRGNTRHQNLVTQLMKFTTPRDNFNQETRYTKTKHDDKTNSLEPTESVAPISYSASPRPKMLYNGSQSYSPDQYDPYYAVYDEDGELYKDTDYVQQYNSASLRPAVQQTYRGTPPSRRPVESYTPRPVSNDDYDDALIQGQINNQNQYQSAIRHSTRGEGNELGYDHNPSSVRTPSYEATSISTTSSTTTSTTTTTTTTQRPTTAPFTEAMTPSRYITRSSTDENPIRKPESLTSQNPIDESSYTTPAPSTLPSIINFSSLAKPFEKTDNVYRLRETSSTEKLPTLRHSYRVTNSNNKVNMDELQPVNERDKKKVLSLTTGFSIRRNSNNTNNPYTLTVLTRPYDDYNKSRRTSLGISKQTPLNRFDKKELESKTKLTDKSDKSFEIMTLQKDGVNLELYNDEDDIPIYNRPTRIKSTAIPKLPNTHSTTSTMKYYIKTSGRRPTPFSINRNQDIEPIKNNKRFPIESATEKAKINDFTTLEPKNNAEISSNLYQIQNRETMSEPVISPYKTLENLRIKDNMKNEFIPGPYSTGTAAPIIITSSESSNTDSPSYYSYRVIDEDTSDQTTEVFSGKVKNVIKAFFNNLVSTSTPKLEYDSTSVVPGAPVISTEKVINIGYQRNPSKLFDEKPLRNNVKHLKIVTEPAISKFKSLSSDDSVNFRENNNHANDNNFTTRTTKKPLEIINPPTTSMMLESSTTNEFKFVPNRQTHESKFKGLMNKQPEIEISHKFQKIIQEPSVETIKMGNNLEPTKPTTYDVESTSKVLNDIASTTSTTKSTSTMKIDSMTATKSISFPTRASRVNPAIKLAATNLGGGRRSYQSTTKCSSDNSLQANPKCNEIKYQRPSSTRGRGSAHYSTGSEGPQPAPNRGTPPTRSRPTLKPSTAIVSKTTEFVDIYVHPPSRSAPVYPQPTPDKTAAKCRKDVCLLPDCYCGGKEIPGDLPVETVPQIVLLTFDDSVNDLNKGLYTDLFEKGRVNPNGCPISATFYVSHEWTDYSQVQNLYAAGHEMASHTISHSFGEQFSQKKWNREVGGQREILAAYGGVKLEDVRGMRAPFLSVGGNKMFKMLYDSNFTYDSSMPVYENRPPSWPYTLDYKLFHDCMIPPCPTKSYPGVWEVPMVMWQDLNGGRCSMGDACANPPDAEGVYKMILKNFDRHYTTNRAPFGLFYHAAWFTQPHHKEGFIMFLDFINQMQDVWIITNWQALQWVRDPTPISRINNFQPFQCNYQDRPKKCNNPKVCNLWHKSGVRYMRTCQPCPEIYPWTGKTGIRSSRIDNDNGE
ncbi:chitin deacetylase-like 5 [Aphomia sociella]